MRSQLRVSFDERPFLQSAITSLSWTEQLQPAVDAITASSWLPAEELLLQPSEAADTDFSLVVVPPKPVLLRDVVALLGRCPSGFTPPPIVLACTAAGALLAHQAVQLLDKRSSLSEIRYGHTRLHFCNIFIRGPDTDQQRARQPQVSHTVDMSASFERGEACELVEVISLRQLQAFARTHAHASVYRNTWC